MCGNGNTVVVSISTDVVGGTTPIVVSTQIPVGVPATTTQAVSTAPVATTPVATVPVTTALPTTQAVPTTANAVTTTTPRVVGQPEPTTGEAGPTIYTYTTVDANGNTQTGVDTYTPTYDVTSVAYSAPAGTIIPYSDYTSVYGGSTAGVNQLNGASRQWAGAGGLIGVAAGLALVL
ncbi:hypothetical protein RSOLAG22IIIB_13219 [Rhizoctonia solani]|uniref:Uncharacterized protein n=1 Tax=Rhizoctonia solani TaxID=456999 RepID=A0A0K6GJ59_9AGAM|nr:hypothetical protein RSOLAG22IIIB_13219 [Rhizoctonia solani]